MTTLLYFPIEGRAWPIRAAFAIGGLTFTDKHVSFPDWFAKEKANAPFGALPTLCVEGKPGTLCQSNAILRYVGRQAGLYPGDLWQAAMVDAFLDSVEECIARFMPIIQAKTDEEKAAALAPAMAYLPGWLASAENFHKNLGAKYVASDDLSVADLKFLAFAKFVGNFGGSLEKYPALAKVVETISSNEKVVAYIKATEH